MMIDTTNLRGDNPVEIAQQESITTAEAKESIHQSSTTWKQKVVSENPLMGRLLQPEFDQANFLYNMYKSCTVGEIEDFKISL